VRSLLLFIALTFAVTWACFFAGVALVDRLGPFVSGLSDLRTPFLLLGTFAPSLVALCLTAVEDGRAGVRALLARMLDSRVAMRWYVFAMGYMGAIKLAVAIAYRVWTGAWPRLGDTPWYVLPMALLISTPVQAGEEIGWRGFALPRLAARIGLARASVVLGVIWACWHLPLFYLPGMDQCGQSFPLFALEVTALSIAITWLYAHTGGSLLMVMLMHSAVNQTVGIVPSAEPAAGNPFALSTSLVMWLTAAFLWIAAAYFLARMPAFDATATATIAASDGRT
jgi:membrane protease YdiL (CAAX protease family)